MIKFLSLLVLFFLFGCQNQKEKNSKIKSIKIETSNERIKDTSTTKSPYFYKELFGDSLLCSTYSRLAPLNKIIFDTLLDNPLKNIKIVGVINFETTINECGKGFEDVYSRKLKLEDGFEIEFIESYINSKDALLTLVNQKLFSVRKLFGEMFSKDSEIYFHYDSGKFYKLSNGNILFVEQPTRWCGTANVYDCYQYFNLKKKEIIQFIEKDEFVNTLK